jgi:cytochrome b561
MCGVIKTSRLPSNTGSETKPSRYHPALVALHWISAVLVLVALATGTFRLTATPNSSPDKIAHLTVHMTLGVAILVLALARLAVRSKTPHPDRASSGNVLLDKVAIATHYGLYVAIILMALTGIVTAAAADLPAIMLAGSSETLPESFSELPPRMAHGLLAQALIALILLHTLGAFYHHLFRKDQLLRRVWFEQRACANLANNMPYRKEAKR